MCGPSAAKQTPVMSARRESASMVFDRRIIRRSFPAGGKIEYSIELPIKEMRNMVLTSRRGFIKGAAAACIALAKIEARGFDSGAAAGLPNSVFAYEFGDISPEQQAGFAREYGFEGTVFDHAQQIPERLRAMDEAHLQLFFLFLTVDISNGQIKYEPGMED